MFTWAASACASRALMASPAPPHTPHAMKRGAERQIQREDGDDPHSLSGDGEEGGAQAVVSDTVTDALPGRR